MNNLKQIALEAGADGVNRRLEKSETLMARTQKHIGIVGPANCGKTTLINGVLDQEVRQPSVLPSDTLPLRVVFDRTMDDDRFECAQVFRQEWCNADVVMYEFSCDRLLKEPQWADELDVLFYLSPLAHFLTADDKKAIQGFEGIQVQVIATLCDRVAADDQEKARQFAVKACERIGLPTPIFAGPDSWQSVSEKMLSALPTTVELLEKRKAHIAAIEKSCKCQLADHIERLIEAENNNQQALQAQYQEQLRKEKLASTTANRIYQEMKLSASSASNEMAAKVRAGMRQIDEFAQQMIAEGKPCKFDEAFRRRMATKSEALVKELVLSIETELNASINALVAEAVAKKVIDEKDIETIRHSGKLPCGNNGIRLDRGTGNEVSYAIQSALGIGAVSAVTLLSRVTTPWTIGLIAASAVAGGAAFFSRNELSRTAKNEASIQDWARSCANDLQATLVPAIQQAYATLGDAMHAPPIARAASAPVPGETRKEARHGKAFEGLLKRYFGK